MIKKLSYFLIITFFSISSIFAVEAEVEKYVHQLITDSLDILNDKTMDAKAKKLKVRTMLSQNLDATWMGRFTIGREVKTLPSEKLQKFIETYTTFVVNSYANAVSAYKGEKVNVKSVDTLSGGFFMVKTQVTKSDSNSINVDYLAHSINGTYKVCDVITEGISLVNSQRSEYTGVISDGGIERLISELVKRSNI